MAEQAMTEISDFEDRARRLEEFAARRPDLYRFNVICLALMGYVYILVVLLFILAAIAGVVYIGTFRHLRYLSFKLAIPLVGLAYLLIKSLFIRIPAPEGVPINRERAVKMWRDIELIQRRLKAPKVHKVLLTSEFNAGVVQVPFLGFFGFHTNYLLIGVPLLLALSPQHFRAVLAHEFGHLSCEHGRTGAFIYRVRSTWGRLLDSLSERDSWGQVLFAKFVGWYSPFLNSYSFALARSQEFEADRISAMITSPQIAAEALVSIELHGMNLGKEFWPDIYAQADAGGEIPAPFTLLEGSLKEPIEKEKAREFLNVALAEHTLGTDTHPSFSDRLKGLGAGTPPPPPLDNNAASYYLDDNVSGFLSYFDDEWRWQIADKWEERRGYVQKAREQLEELRGKMETDEKLPLDEEWQYASLLEEVSGTAAALPYYRKMAAEASEFADAHFAVGRILLGHHENEEGIPYLERAMELHHNYVIESCDMISSYLRRKGRASEADRYHSRLAQQSEVYRQATLERESVAASDQLKSHTADDEAVSALKQQISSYQSIKAVYLAEKVVHLFPEHPLYVLGIKFRLPWHRFRSEKNEAKQLSELAQALHLPGETVLLNLSAKAHRKTMKKMTALSRSLLYSTK